MYNSADDRTGVWGYCYCTIFEVHMFWLSFTDVSFFFLLLVLDWLYSCAFHSNPAQVGPSESPVLFSGTVGAASTFSPLASNDLPVSVTTVSTNVFFLLTSWLCCHILSSKTFLTFCQEISAMVPPPSTSADRLGLVLLGCIRDVLWHGHFLRYFSLQLIGDNSVLFHYRYLLILDRTNWKTNMLTALLVPYIFFTLPNVLFSLIRWLGT